MDSVQRRAYSVQKKSGFWLRSSLLSVIACSFIFGCLVANARAQDKIVAIVNGEALTSKDLNDFLNFTRVQLSTQYSGRELENRIQSMKLNLLDRLIEDRLILQEAKRALEEAKKNKDVVTLSRLSVDENTIKERIAAIKKKFSSESDFQKSLAQQGMVQADVELRLKEQILTYNIVDLKIKDAIVVTPTEVTDFYEKNKGEFYSPPQREFDLVSVEDQRLVSGITNLLKKGQPLEEIANSYSVTVSRLTAAPGELRKEVEDILFKLEIGQVSPPIKNEDVLNVFRLTKIIPPQQESLIQVQDTIHDFLFERRLEEKLVEWLDEVKKRSYIKIF